MKKIYFGPIVVLAALTMLAGCQKTDDDSRGVGDAPTSTAQMSDGNSATSAIKIDAVVMGSALDADSQISVKSNVFNSHDTIYSVIQYSAPADSTRGKLATKWEHEDGTVIADNKEDIVFSKSGHIERRISNEAGLPIGKYQLTVSTNGGPSTVVDFEITK